MNKRIKKKKDSIKQWNGVRIITLSTPRWKRLKTRMKMGRCIGKCFEVASIIYPNGLLLEKDIKYPYKQAYFIGEYNSQKTTP